LKNKIQRNKKQLKLANVFPRRNHMEEKKIKNCTENCGSMRRKVKVDLSSKRKKQQ